MKLKSSIIRIVMAAILAFAVLAISTPAAALPVDKSAASKVTTAQVHVVNITADHLFAAYTAAPVREVTSPPARALVISSAKALTGDVYEAIELTGVKINWAGQHSPPELANTSSGPNPTRSAPDEPGWINDAAAAARGASRVKRE